MECLDGSERFVLKTTLRLINCVGCFCVFEDDLPVEILLELGERERLNVDEGRARFWRTVVGGCLRRCVVGEIVVNSLRSGVDVVKVLELFVKSCLGGFELLFMIAEFGLRRRPASIENLVFHWNLVTLRKWLIRCYYGLLPDGSNFKIFFMGVKNNE